MTEPQPRERVRLTDNLPKIPVERRIEDIRKILEANEFIRQKYIPEEKKLKYEKNFRLFDRNYDGLLIYEEVKQFLISIGQMIAEEDLKEFYQYLLTTSEDKDGLAVEGLQFQSKDKVIQISWTLCYRK